MTEVRSKIADRDEDGLVGIGEVIAIPSLNIRSFSHFRCVK
jgi:hypothetical protein